LGGLGKGGGEYYSVRCRAVIGRVRVIASASHFYYRSAEGGSGGAEDNKQHVGGICESCSHGELT